METTDLEAANLALKEEIEELKAELAQREDTVATLESEISFLNDELIGMREKFNANLIELANCKEAIESLIMDVGLLEGRINELLG